MRTDAVIPTDTGLGRRRVFFWPRIDLAPAALIGLAVLACLVIAILLSVVLWLSFLDGMIGDTKLVYTLDHYREVFLNGFTYRVLGNTTLFMLTTLGVSLCFALPIAWLIERTDFPAKPIVFALMTIGLLLPGFAVALGWVFLFNPNIGLVNQAAASLFGLERPLFNISSIAGMGLVEGLSLTPLGFVLLSVVLRSMDPALEEAALMSGARPSRVALRVTLRVLSPGLVGAVAYICAVCFAAFDVPAILGLTSRIYTFSTYIFHALSPSSGPPEYGVVATLSVIMVAFAMLLSWCVIRTQRQASRYAVVTGKSYRPRLTPLGRGRFPAILFVIAYFVAAQLLPLLMLLWAAALPYLEVPSAAAFADISLQNFREMPTALLTHAAINTAVLMVAVPTITLIVSFGIAWTVLRSKIPGRGIFDFFAMLPLTVPAIVFAVAALLVALFFLRHILPIYGTLWILIAAYTISRISYGTRMMSGALIQIHREIEEAASVAGASTAGILLRVIVPLLLPAFLYAWIWIALLSYRELALPVILATDKNMPLSVLVWGYTQASGYGIASAATLAILAIMAPILCLYGFIARRAGMIVQR
jgi:iron(III) transport system permease protein